jgi:hypothetical protein
MARTQARTPDRERLLRPGRRLCPACGGAMRIHCENKRTLVTLTGTVRLRLKIRRCEVEGCARFHKPYRPEAEGALALPQHEFGLDVVALVGALRHRDHRSVPEIHAILREGGVPISERSVTNLLDRYDEVLATQLSDRNHLRRQLADQGRIILALDGLQPDLGHEVLSISTRRCPCICWRTLGYGQRYHSTMAGWMLGQHATPEPLSRPIEAATAHSS